MTGYKIVEKQNILAVHGLFDSFERKGVNKND